jgi:hypothetical protein
MRARYLIILTAVVLGLVVASPVSAFYSLSVSGMSANPAFSPGFQSPFKDFSQQSSPSAFDVMKDYKPATVTGPLQGSVRAYSNGMYQDGNTAVKFSESVSVNGEIYSFSYSASFNSGNIR